MRMLAVPLAALLVLCSAARTANSVLTRKPVAEHTGVQKIDGLQRKPEGTALVEARKALLRRFPQTSRGGALAARVLEIEREHGVGPTVELLFNSANGKRGRFIATTYHPRFNNRFCASGVQYLHYSGYRVASNAFPFGTRLCLRYKGKSRYHYCVVIVADTGKLYKDSPGVRQIDCSDAVARALGLYVNNNRYGDYVVLSAP